ncbi:phosphoribosylglycinamide formyltransferase [Candidatus Saganbacteria bacterium CG08_land_8_20_14_0_20_45_16]|uniref:Phosphoribosylglycinamide formyltransferase n=1 Tax=Candidatus Saganbacteria bacterium CG08_land_8_20_14_0_20_45_16 TaxID=2014293 RepID=A0A2H0Y1X5_UNCSA|nr:MAG: phosphoribosylglycinamide formyltransferase [Candidatus Saganbacteria bacterium CG08_land_8_20_14_0_20_45_16]
MINIGVLISGRGSNLQAIIEACENGDISARVAIVISNKAEVYGLERARQRNIPTAVLTSEKEIVQELEKYEVELVCLAGYMKIVGAALLKKYFGKMINIHPSLLPSFPGLHGQKQALDYGVKVSGVTVHFVDEGCDTGPIILQATVPVLDDDTEDTLSARILEQEHKLYPQTIKLFAQGKLQLVGRKVCVSA